MPSNPTLPQRSLASHPTSSIEKSIGSGVEALAPKEVLTTTQASCERKGSTKPPTSSSGGTSLATTLMGDPLAWMLYLMSNSCSKKYAGKHRLLIRLSILQWLLIFNSRTNQHLSCPEVLRISQE